jgi:hypothetical protein
MSLILLLLQRRQSKICCRCSKDASRMLQVLEAALPEHTANVVLKAEAKDEAVADAEAETETETSTAATLR